MDIGAVETWQWIWIALAVGFTVGELMVAGTFVLLPFGAGAAAAAVAAFVGASLVVTWAVFLAVAVAGLLGMIPLRRRFDARTGQAKVGAGRWVNREAVVLQDIPAGHGATGLIRLDREEWRAESLTGIAIPTGSTVLVSRVDGTRLVVVPLDMPSLEEGRA